jgi:NADPH:quinone reductase-like Zn-dependent oxidoreductase
MKAVVQRAYGSAHVLQIQDIERPVPAADEVLVQVRAASVHPDVWHVLTGLPYVLRILGAGLRRPRNPVPGTDLAGVVVALGSSVTRFAVGDAVFGETIRGMQWVNGGAYAEYATAPENGLALKPQGVSFEAAAAVPTSALIALASLRSAGEIQPGQAVLVNGAAGGVGSIAVQLAKASGAHVTGVDSGSRLDLVRAAGADVLIDYTQDDFTRRAERYDLVFDVPGNHPFSACRRVLKPTGVYVLVGHDHYGKGMRRWLGLMPRMVGLMLSSMFVKQLPRAGGSPPDKQASMATLRELMASGRLSARIDRSFPLAEAAAAIRYLQEGQARGKVLIVP